MYVEEVNVELVTFLDRTVLANSYVPEVEYFLVIYVMEFREVVVEERTS